MAWPTNKASTDNVDSPYDLISQARTDILQNILNVNAIIDFFQLTDDSAGQLEDGQLLQYDAASGAFVAVDADAVASTKVALVNIIAGEENVSGDIYRRALNIISDTSNIATSNDSALQSYTIDLVAGTYIVSSAIITDNSGPGAANQDVAPTIFNEDTSTELAQFTANGIQNSLTSLYDIKAVFTLASASTISIRQETSDLLRRNMFNKTVEFMKII